MKSADFQTGIPVGMFAKFQPEKGKLQKGNPQEICVDTPEIWRTYLVIFFFVFFADHIEINSWFSTENSFGIPMASEKVQLE